jgi:hypothetical protein
VQTVATRLLDDFDRDRSAGLSSSEFEDALDDLHASELGRRFGAAAKEPETPGDRREQELRRRALFSLSDANGDRQLDFVELVEALETLEAEASL